MPGEPIRVLASFAVLFLVACGEPQAQGGDWTWELSVSHTDLAAPVTSSGGSSIGGIKDECFEVVTWPDGEPDRKGTLNVCDGVYTLDPSHSDWVATFKRGQ
jgi:hypothetical protein